VGSAINDNNRVDMPSGVVRAFDARTGVLRWSWDPLEKNDQSLGIPVGTAKTWQTGAGNAWSIMAVDSERDLVFIPTGSASPDYYGGLRPGDDKWADSVVAVRGKTGEFVWGFQLVHHDDRGRRCHVVLPGPVAGHISERYFTFVAKISAGNACGTI
jgi:quinoprotein glucose dehydrogenase